MSSKALFNAVKGKKVTKADYDRAVKYLLKSGDIIQSGSGYRSSSACGMFTAQVVRVNKTFGFVKIGDANAGTEEELFVPGKYLRGALPGDIVVCSYLESRGGFTNSKAALPEVKVEAVACEGSSEFSGIVEREDGTVYVRPDSFCRDRILIDRNRADAKEGDRVLAVVTKRGERHSEHQCDVIAVFGSADRAVSSAQAILYMNNIETDFPVAVLDEARHIGSMKITEKDIYSRLDLREEIIFTIDGADTKDIDDAVSVTKTDNGYKLGVHIADVSHFVAKDSQLDKDAFLRGTSIYYANKVIPMLPPELSNGICSLNPNEDRLAFSCLMELSDKGEVLKFKFSKTVIRSRVKGVYSEINDILAHRGDMSGIDSAVAEKYAGLEKMIYDMDELADILIANRIKRGAPQLETSEPKLTIDENDVCVDVMKRERGKAEAIIEEFMLMANTCAARLAREKEIPFVFRVHEDPAPEKVGELIDVCSRLNIPVPHFTEIKPAHLAAILEAVKESELMPVVNMLVLRSMAKAKYSDEPLGHFGLVLRDYAHFTSPIRRYPDLAIHRILTELCYNKTPADVIVKKYGKFAFSAAAQSSECELTAMRVERDCDSCYIAEYMSTRLGEEFEGRISGVTEYGFYVELPNTAEGMVKIETLPDGTYDYDGSLSLTRDGKPVYTVGGSVRVKCVKADIAGGKIDFIIV